MSDSDRPGLKTTLAAEVKAAAPRAAAPETADLFEAENAKRMPMAEPAGVAVPRAGRPKGAQNVRTRVVADYYLNRFGDPLEALLRMGMRPISDFVQELQAVADKTGVRLVGKNQSLRDLVNLQVQAIDAALPYLRQRMPLAVDVETTRRDVLILGNISPEQRERAAAFGLDLDAVREPAKPLELQAVPVDDDEAAPHETAPHEG